MITRFLFILPIILLFDFSVLKGQDMEVIMEVIKEGGMEIGIRVNTIADQSSDRFYGGFNGFSTEQSIKYSYYYGGITVSDIRPNNFFYRLRFDYFYYNAKYRYKFDFPNSDYIINDGDYNIKAIQFTPGMGKLMTYKYLSFKIGVEIPVYFAGAGKQEASTRNYFSSNSNNDETKIFTDYPKGGYFIGLATFFSLGYNLSNDFTLAFELSSGIYYSSIKGTIEATYEYYNTNGDLYDTKTNRDEIDNRGVITDLVNPSIGLSYRF